MLWDSEARVRELLGEEVADLWVTRRTFAMRYRSPRHYIDSCRTYYGPTLKACESLDAAGQERLVADLEELVRRRNTSGDETAVLPSDYLEIVAVRR